MENFEKHYSIERNEKPPFLYHASQNRNIEEFTPRAEKVRDANEGPVVFATPDLALATTFLVRADDAWSQKGKINGITYIAIRGEKKFRQRDKGGSIYRLSSNSFDFDPHKGMGKDEWVSKNSVKPLEKTDVDSALEAMITNGVQVYFVEKKSFYNLVYAKSGEEILDVLESMQSENKKRGKNVFQFENKEEK